jgi:hypothetical protein
VPLRVGGALSATAVVAAVALGGAGGVAAAGTDELTKKEFIAAADDLCTKADDVLGAIVFDIASQSGGGPPTAAQIEQFVQYLVPAYQNVHDDIDDLAEPRADRARIKKLLATFQRELDAIERDPTRVQRPSGAFPKSAKLARGYGLEVCAR